MIVVLRCQLTQLFLALCKNFLVLVIALISACQKDEVTVYESSSQYTPVVLTYEELRQPVFMDEARPIQVNGKIVLYQQYLLINEPQKGVHVVDNSNPRAPVSIGFIAIAGNTDVVVKNDLLFANNYVDLLILDISDMPSVVTHQRLESVFKPPYLYIDVDEGVVIGMKWSDGQEVSI